MPEIKSKNIAVALDMHGCPNRCRHCYLGYGSDTKMSAQDLRWVAQLFRNYVRSGETVPFIGKLTVSSWFREPDFSDDYECLYELEAELSDDKPARFELLSVWRLARDENYAKWAKKIGTEICQITFFGMEETNDWFYRRKGAFEDNLAATERLLEAGIKPRWQICLTKKVIPEIGQILKLIEQLKLRDKVKSLGGDFVVFLHTPSPDGEARKIEYLRPAIEETKLIPSEIVEESKKHFKQKRLWYPESELISQILAEEEKFPYAYPYPQPLWFLIDANWDIFSNVGPLEPWWKLDNLKRDTVQAIFNSFENNKAVGLETIYGVSPKKLAKRFGNTNNRIIYSSRNELEILFVGKYCEEIYYSGK